jgi:hypothetical protein
MVLRLNRTYGLSVQVRYKFTLQKVCDGNFSNFSNCELLREVPTGIINLYQNRTASNVGMGLDRRRRVDLQILFYLRNACHLTIMHLAGKQGREILRNSTHCAGLLSRVLARVASLARQIPYGDIHCWS